jgi:hypothetical protein
MNHYLIEFPYSRSVTDSNCMWVTRINLKITEGSFSFPGVVNIIHPGEIIIEMAEPVYLSMNDILMSFEGKGTISNLEIHHNPNQKIFYWN